MLVVFKDFNGLAHSTDVVWNVSLRVSLAVDQLLINRTKRQDRAIDVCRLDMFQLTACGDDSRIKCRFSLP